MSLPQDLPVGGIFTNASVRGQATLIWATGASVDPGALHICNPLTSPQVLYLLLGVDTVPTARIQADLDPKTHGILAISLLPSFTNTLAVHQRDLSQCVPTANLCSAPDSCIHSKSVFRTCAVRRGSAIGRHPSFRTAVCQIFICYHLARQYLGSEALQM